MFKCLITILIYCTLVVILTFTNSCSENNGNIEKCKKYETENYKYEPPDTTLLRQAHEYHKILLGRFNEEAVSGINHDAYHLQFYSSHGYGKSIKYLKKNLRYSLIVKCLSDEEWSPDCKEYNIDIQKTDWDELEEMIYEFDFWTDENFRTNEGVLDGYAYLLEGNRPGAKSCGKKTSNLIARGSPRYDKIGALCKNILEHEKQLRFKYEHFNIIK